MAEGGDDWERLIEASIRRAADDLFPTLVGTIGLPALLRGLMRNDNPLQYAMFLSEVRRLIFINGRTHCRKN
jgi:hypothetical protein